MSWALSAHHYGTPEHESMFFLLLRFSKLIAILTMNVRDLSLLTNFTYFYIGFVRENEDIFIV